MKLLITGGAGFIGSAVVRRAIAQGHSVVNVDALTYAASPEALAAVADHPQYRFVQADVCDRSALAACFESHQPDVVMHLAAESHVDRSIDRADSCVATNILGTFELLEATRAYWQGAGSPTSFRFHQVSTDEVFGALTPTAAPFTENSPYLPRSPYAASKASADHLVSAWHTTYGLPVVLSNCSNNFGPFQHPEKLIPLTILKALAGEPIPLYGDGSAVRDWLFVEDHAEALLCIAQKGAVGQRYNVGAHCERSNRDTVTLICHTLDTLRPRPEGSYCTLITEVADRPGHDARYAIDATRLTTELHWQSQYDFETAIAQTVQWYLENEAWWRPRWAQNGGARLGLRYERAS